MIKALIMDGDGTMTCWYVRHMPKDGRHSFEAIKLVKEFVAELEQIPDGGCRVLSI